MDDYLLRVIARDVGVRGFVALTTNLANEAAEQHETLPTATAVLGEGLTAGILLGAMLKVQQRVALKIEGDGPIGKVVVEGDSYGRIRGYVLHPELNFPAGMDGQDTAVAIGSKGQFVVVRDLRLKELAESVTSLQTGDIAQELTAYLNQSEQIPSLVQIGVYLDESGAVSLASALLIQALPPYETAVVQQLTDHIAEMPPVGELLRAGHSPEEVMALVFAGMEYEVLEKRPLTYQCNCSWDRTWKALVSLGADEVREMLETDGRAEVTCQFCHTEYHFDAEDLQMILAELEA
ncbi:MAG: Hsp33 family molecular chaperone HslO [Ardenticatenaceae bacterium]|nr:Hsp33 family molecular chaperone HslO [Anaerolineales bacterium]MCB8920195.1 Hsp33 family molecular chaperone HslO [Ardenticatenaceae bacterium]